MSLQAILAGTTGNGFSPIDQEYLVSTRFYPPSLQAHLSVQEHAGIVELVKAVTIFSTTWETTHKLPSIKDP
ncbi:unnamed protein product [Hymenolepis diminuta]|uniref:Uncharacterized protein n=1 Tax=Hymenolepis diminuta TaxID=6216 RepID=A0A564YP90_HYMDI|nr:unnamed protein product [Hymenolepis diminuta]